MLTTDQVDHFRTFGFAVLRGYLADRVAVLCAEAGAAIRDACSATYDERVIDGISGHYLPMASRLTPASASLVCDDPRFAGAAEQLRPGHPRVPRGGAVFFRGRLAHRRCNQRARGQLRRLPGELPWVRGRDRAG